MTELRPIKQKIELRSIYQKEAFEFVSKHHRELGAPRGSLWQHAVHDCDDGRLIGVAIVGRPVARNLDDRSTCEVTRLCTLGGDNVCSMLYGAAWRAARPLGYRRILTYILESETGASLRAAGWELLGTSGCNSWNRPSRPREDKHPLGPKRRYGKGAWRELGSAAA